MFNEVESQLAYLDREVIKAEGQVESLSKTIEIYNQQLVEAQTTIQDYSVVIPFIETCSTVARDQAKTRIEELVTRALQIVMGDQRYQFLIVLEHKRNQLEADFIIRWQDIEGDPRDTFGGSLSDVINTFLTVIIGQLLQIKGPLVLDEPFRMLDGDNMNNASSFLAKVSRELGRQIICITHSRVLAGHADNTIVVSKKGDYSTVVDGLSYEAS